jgi:hypothetical protein
MKRTHSSIDLVSPGSSQTSSDISSGAGLKEEEVDTIIQQLLHQGVNYMYRKDYYKQTK